MDNKGILDKPKPKLKRIKFKFFHSNDLSKINEYKIWMPNAKAIRTKKGRTFGQKNNQNPLKLKAMSILHSKMYGTGPTQFLT